MTNIDLSNDRQLWHILYTKPKFEKKIYQRLSEENIQAFLPLHKTIRQWSDRKKKIELPLFPNYIFVSTKNEDRWKVLNISGVVKFVSFAGSPATVQESEIETIKKMLSLNPEVSNDVFLPDTKLIIVDGPLKGLKGVLVEKKGKSRVAIEINTLDKSIIVDVSPHYLTRAD